MKHKRIASGVQNCALFQNTQRIPVPKKNAVIDTVLQTQRKNMEINKQNNNQCDDSCNEQSYVDNSQQQQYQQQSQYYQTNKSSYNINNNNNQQYQYALLQQILHKTDTNCLYQQFLTFQHNIHSMLLQHNTEQATKNCYLFKNNIKQILNNAENQWYLQQSYGVGDNDRKNGYGTDHVEQIKYLLEEVYELRRKLAELDGSVHMNSISSLNQENINMITETSESKLYTSQHKSRFSHRIVQNQPVQCNKQIVFPTISQDNQNQHYFSQQAFVNYEEIKKSLFQLFCLLWRCTRTVLPDESQVLIQEINKYYDMQYRYKEQEKHQHFKNNTINNKLQRKLRQSRQQLDYITYLLNTSSILVNFMEKQSKDYSSEHQR